MVSTRADFVHTKPLVHPYAALGLLLALSGSPTWTADEVSSQAEAARRGGWNESGATTRQSGRREDGLDEELARLAGDSSKLWSTDSEHEEEGEGGEKGDSELLQEEDSLGGVRGNGDNDGEGGATAHDEWLEAFQDDHSDEATSTSSGYTDGERYHVLYQKRKYRELLAFRQSYYSVQCYSLCIHFRPFFLLSFVAVCCAVTYYENRALPCGGWQPLQTRAMEVPGANPMGGNWTGDPIMLMIGTCRPQETRRGH